MVGTVCEEQDILSRRERPKHEEPRSAFRTKGFSGTFATGKRPQWAPNGHGSRFDAAVPWACLNGSSSAVVGSGSEKPLCSFAIFQW